MPWTPDCRVIVAALEALFARGVVLRGSAGQLSAGAGVRDRFPIKTEGSQA